MRFSGHRRRCGSAYIVALGTAMLVSVIGLSALAVVRIQRRTAEGWNDLIHARFHARSAIEKGLFWVDEITDWRTTLSNGTWVAGEPIGLGTLTLQGIDPQDGDLADSAADPLLLIGIGTQGQACHTTQVTLLPVIEPLAALNSCLHSDGQLTVTAGNALVVTTAGVSTNGHAQIDGAVFGDLEAASYSVGGMVQGTVTVPAPPKQMPDPGVFAMYASMATPIICPPVISGQVLAPGYNPWGAANPDGIYCIDTTGNDLVIQGSRVHGTLVIKTHGGRVILQDAVLLHAYRPDYPVLIVNGQLEMPVHGNSSSLSEDEWAANFNPAGAPYLGTADSDMQDTYPNEVVGLVHVYGSFRMQETARVRGVVICEEAVTCEGFNEIIHDPSLHESPPMGYTAVTGMEITAGSWQRRVAE